MTAKHPNALFLIVTPSYNQGRFIRQTIDSVLAQQSENITIKYIVIDGKSQDDTVDILKSYKNEIEWKSEKDAGQTDALNKGIRKFVDQFSDKDQEVFFAYINSDDYYFPQAFEKVFQEFTVHPEKMWLVGDAKIIDENNSEIQWYIRLYKKLIRFIFPQWILFILNPYPQPATFIRFSALQKIGEFNTTLRYTMDYEYWLRLRKEFGNPILTAHTLAAFRIHGSSKGGSQFEKQFQEEEDVAQQFTSNQILLFLHKIHISMIQWVYKKIK